MVKASFCINKLDRDLAHKNRCTKFRYNQSNRLVLSRSHSNAQSKRNLLAYKDAIY